VFGHSESRRSHALRTLPAVLLAALLLPGLVPGSAKAVTTAPQTTEMPWSVRLTFYKPSGANTVCSGVALTQHWIVTAAHCLHGRAKSTDQVRVDYGGSYSSTPLYAQGTASFYNHPDYDHTQLGFIKGDRGDDLGLVRLYGDGIFPELRAKIWDGHTNWKDGAKIFFAAGYGYGSDPGASEDCDDGRLGLKRLGRFKLTGNTDDNGILGLGNPIAVEARSIGKNRICPGDSGSPWAFSVGAAENGEKFVFALTGGTWNRSNPFLGGNYWAALIRPKLFWITDIAAEKGVPINCPRLDDLGSYHLYRQCSEGYWMASRSAASEPVRMRSEATSLTDVAFADFDGDGAADAFRSNRGAWYILYAGDRDWTKVKLSRLGVESLRFADFDGDGATDVLQSGGGVWSVSFANKGAKSLGGWLKVKTDSTRVDALRIGDFDGDGASDALRSSGGAWYVSYSPHARPDPGYTTRAIPPGPPYPPGSVYPTGIWSDWVRVKSSDFPVGSLAVGDFDGDGVDDIFRSTGGAWYVSYATKERTDWGAWYRQKTADVALGQVAMSDFNGDGADDIFRSTGGGWHVTYGTRDRSTWGSWTRVRSSTVRQDSLAFADLDGDRRTDVVFHTTVDGTPSPRGVGS
jgi:Trypsin/FG-GAP-like repeat